QSDAGVFSFYPTKPLGGYGDGGIIVTRDARLAERLRRLRYYGMNGAYYAEEPGHNCRLDEVHAEILRYKLGRLETYLQRRRALARRYAEILAPTSLCLPRVLPANEHVYYLYVVRHPDRDRLITELKRHDIHLGVHYPWPLHTMRGFQRPDDKPVSLPNTEANAKIIFTLPMYPSLTEEKQDLVCRALGEALGEPLASDCRYHEHSYP
ncbi:MAG TPA: DegT/DnrJ/EryC1/StrS family aminotransferase, partial [Opitutaceae bacterium]|nr:DegT/DnrJ/EryC1/StrS family aminotransferase [Opitutaceae bacterium]